MKRVIPPTYVDNTQLKCVNVAKLMRYRNELIARHEDQLATVTQLCKQEISLLMGVRTGSMVSSECKLDGQFSNPRFTVLRRRNPVSYRHRHITLKPHTATAEALFVLLTELT